MSDFEKNDEFRRKYDDTLKDISSDIEDINNNSDEIKIEDNMLSGDESYSEFGSYEPEPYFAYSDDTLGIPDYNSDASEVLADQEDVFISTDSVAFKNEFDTAPLYNVSDDFENNDEIYNETIEFITCEECNEVLYDYVSDCTDEYESKAIESHLSGCEECRMEYDDIRDMIAVMNSAKAPVAPANLISNIHMSLVEASLGVKDEYNANLAANKTKDTFADKAKDFWFVVKDRTDYFIKHANWRIVAPAALSAILVVGVSATGLYQVMKSSDDIYDFNDNPSVASSRATSRPSNSGLDDYLDNYDDDNNIGSPRTTSSPRSSSLPRTTASSSANTRATTKPSTSNSTSSSNKTTGSTGTKNSNGVTTSSSSRASATPKPVATSTPKYKTPEIVLPDVSNFVKPVANPTPVPVAPKTEEPVVSAFDNTSDGGGGGGGTPGGSGGSGGSGGTIVAPSPDPTLMPTEKPSEPTGSPMPVATPETTTKPVLDRNSKGETKAYTNIASKMDGASVVSCVIEDQRVLDVLLNSALMNCSKIDDLGEITLYLTSDEYTIFAKFVKDNNVEYNLISLGDKNDVKIVLQAPDLILSTPAPTAKK